MRKGRSERRKLIYSMAIPCDKAIRPNLSKRKRRMIRKQKFKCYYCQERITFKTGTVDHLLPVSRGGRHSKTNMVACCAPCNRSKGAMTEREFRDAK